MKYTRILGVAAALLAVSAVASQAATPAPAAAAPASSSTVAAAPAASATSVQVFSGDSRLGIDEARAVVSGWLELQSPRTA